MKKLSKIAQVTFFAAAFAVLFSGTAEDRQEPGNRREQKQRSRIR